MMPRSRKLTGAAAKLKMNGVMARINAANDALKTKSLRNAYDSQNVKKRKRCVSEKKQEKIATKLETEKKTK